MVRGRSVTPRRELNEAGEKEMPGRGTPRRWNWGSSLKKRRLCRAKGYYLEESGAWQVGHILDVELTELPQAEQECRRNAWPTAAMPAANNIGTTIIIETTPPA